MAQVVVRCPNCKAKYRINNENLLGPRLQCAKCGTAFRVKGARKKTAGTARSRSRKEEVLEDVWLDDEQEAVQDAADDAQWDADSEWLDDDLGGSEEPHDSPAALSTPRSQPRKQRSKQRPKKSAGGAVTGDKKKESESKAISPWMIAGIAAISVGLLTALGFMGRAVMNGGLLAAEEVTTPTSYENYNTKWKQFSCKYPSDWEIEGGGGINNVPAWVRMSKGKATIEIRVNKSQSMIISLEKSSGGLGVRTMPLVVEMHYHQKDLLKDIFSNYSERNPQEVKSYYGSAAVSEFTASSFLGGELRGYRGTVLGDSAVDQLRVTCVCPETQWQALKPAFHRVIESLCHATQEELDAMIAEELEFQKQAEKWQAQAEERQAERDEEAVPLDELGAMIEDGFEFGDQQPAQPEEPVEPPDNSEFEKFLEKDLQ